MKEISELILPDDVRYADDHEWAHPENGAVRIGISDYAQDQLGDIVFVDLPEVGDSFEKGQEFGTIESVKVVSEMYMPLGGEIVAVNENLEDTPELINQDPYNDGWIVEVKPTDPSEIDDLMTKEEYLSMLESEE